MPSWRAKPPVDYDAVGHRGERMVEAHRFFSEQAREWLAADGADAVAARAAAIETVVRELLQIVVIDLTIDENAQEIFETLNARGAQLTAADLIKNFIFQRLLETGTDVEDAYQKTLEGVRDGILGNGSQRRAASLSSVIDLPQSLADCAHRRRSRRAGGVRPLQAVRRSRRRRCR